jgi:hypothetical protein
MFNYNKNGEFKKDIYEGEYEETVISNGKALNEEEQIILDGIKKAINDRLNEAYEIGFKDGLGFGIVLGTAGAVLTTAVLSSIFHK